MSAYTYIERDTIISSKPCKLYSVIIYGAYTDPSSLNLYDGVDAGSGRTIAQLHSPGKRTTQYGFNGLECPRGLFVDFVDKVDTVTVEWDPLPLKQGAVSETE